MADTSDINREGFDLPNQAADMTAPDVNAWFVREVLPQVRRSFVRLNRKRVRKRLDDDTVGHLVSYWLRSSRRCRF